MAIGTFLVALDMMWLLANMPDSPVAELITTLPNAIGLVFGIVLLPGGASILLWQDSSLPPFPALREVESPVSSHACDLYLFLLPGGASILLWQDSSPHPR